MRIRALIHCGSGRSQQNARMHSCAPIPMRRQLRRRSWSSLRPPRGRSQHARAAPDAQRAHAHAAPGRAMAYQPETCELLLAGAGEEIFRLSLERGCFLKPFASGCHGINVLGASPAHGARRRPGDHLVERRMRSRVPFAEIRCTTRRDDTTRRDHIYSSPRPCVQFAETRLLPSQGAKQSLYRSTPVL